VRIGRLYYPEHTTDAYASGDHTFSWERERVQASTMATIYAGLYGRKLRAGMDAEKAQDMVARAVGMSRQAYYDLCEEILDREIDGRWSREQIGRWLRERGL
jgi:hypothetical protein